MPLRCWRFRFAYKAVFLLCISWYAVQLIQTAFLSSQEEQLSHGAREITKLKERYVGQPRKIEAGLAPLAYSNGSTKEDGRMVYKSNRIIGVERKNKRTPEGGHQRKLNVIHTRQNTGQLDQGGVSDDHVFIQTNSSVIIIKHIPVVHNIPPTKEDRNSRGRPLADNPLPRQNKYPVPRAAQINRLQRAKIHPIQMAKLQSQQKGLKSPDDRDQSEDHVKLSTKDSERSKKLFSSYQFDVTVSDQIPLNRSVPDDRPQRCKAYVYRDDLPRTSIIITFHNEAKSTLLRTIHSIINRSPGHLITEIILINDASNLGDWHRSPWLHRYLANFSVPIHLLHSSKRLGLVGARMLGISKASNSSEVVTFLDSHCECTDGWLEPLLQRISKDRTRVVSPVVDAIDDHTFQYVSTFSWPRIGGFSWFPEFMWIRVPPKEKKRVYGDISLPLRTPTISGGLFAIDKSFFRQLGFYDPGLKIWGGENLELSFKVWQCGGSLEIIPCSRVGHVFRRTTPYSFLGDPEQTFLHNNRRILETWADEYINIFYALTPKYKEVQYGNVEDRRKLKASLKCHDFDWYLKNVYPSHILPQDYQHLGQILNQGAGLCLDNSGEGKKLGSRVTLIPCKLEGMNQIISWNRYNQLQHDRYCLTPQGENNYVSLELCALGKTTNARRQEWSYNEENHRLIHIRTHQCLTAEQSDENTLSNDKQSVLITSCSEITEQMWILRSLSLDKRRTDK